MMKAPADESIRAAELRVERARLDLATGKTRAKAALTDFAVKPATLTGIAVIAGAAGYYLFRRPPVVPDDWRSRLSKFTRGLVPQRASTPTETAATSAATTTGILGIVVALAMKYATRQLPGIGYRVLEQALRRRGAFGGSVPSRPGTTLH